LCVHTCILIVHCFQKFHGRFHLLISAELGLQCRGRLCIHRHPAGCCAAKPEARGGGKGDILRRVRRRRGCESSRSGPCYFSSSGGKRLQSEEIWRSKECMNCNLTSSRAVWQMHYFNNVWLTKCVCLPQAIKTPYWGVQGAYTKAKDPWTAVDMRSFLYSFYAKTFKWLSKVRKAGVFSWFWACKYCMYVCMCSLKVLKVGMHADLHQRRPLLFISWGVGNMWACMYASLVHNSHCKAASEELPMFPIRAEAVLLDCF
jgi:hypothetical protein